ncbi:unnamed protein product, partial [Urochloa humidicola]
KSGAVQGCGGADPPQDRRRRHKFGLRVGTRRGRGRDDPSGGREAVPLSRQSESCVACQGASPRLARIAGLSKNPAVMGLARSLNSPPAQPPYSTLSRAPLHTTTTTATAASSSSTSTTRTTPRTKSVAHCLRGGTRPWFCHGAPPPLLPLIQLGNDDECVIFSNWCCSSSKPKARVSSVPPIPPANFCTPGHEGDMLTNCSTTGLNRAMTKCLVKMICAMTIMEK